HLIHKNKQKNDETISVNANIALVKITEETPLSTLSLSNIKTEPMESQGQNQGNNHESLDYQNFYPSIDAGNKSAHNKEKISSYLPKNKPSISLENEKRLKEVEGKFTIKELSEKFNISTSALYYWAKKNHYHPKNGNVQTSIPEELQDEILKYLNTMSIAELARKYDIPYHTLYYWIKKQGTTAKKTSEFPLFIQQELREKCRTSSLKILAKEYRLSEQTLRSRLKNIGCFSDGQDGFLIVDEVTVEEIKSFYGENGINKTAEKFYTTKIAIKSFLKK
ncbi:MAG: helix-turn-helix domain-containing protein, partial [Lachnospiraceae bacterium]|nr:helix-turn-helix domain-containing protein [Lachnospiraceae bacterium]